MSDDPGTSGQNSDSEESLAIRRAEAAFRRAFRALHLDAPVPSIEVRFRQYARMRSELVPARSGSIRANLSDLLRDAPADALDSLAVTLLARFYRKPVRDDARSTFDQWASRPEIVTRRLRTQRARGRKRMLPPRGVAHDLEELFDELNERFFDGALRKPALGWSLHPSRRRMGHYDPAHEAIVVNRALDCPHIPQLAVEFVLYHEMLHVKHPAETCTGRYRVHTETFRADECRFPRIKEAKRMLASIGPAMSAARTPG